MRARVGIISRDGQGGTYTGVTRITGDGEGLVLEIATRGTKYTVGVSNRFAVHITTDPDPFPEPEPVQDKTRVEFEYFREGGTYYSEGETHLPECDFYEALNQVRDLLNRGERPGLTDGTGLNVLVTVHTEHGPLSHLFVRKADGTV